MLDYWLHSRATQKQQKGQCRSLFFLAVQEPEDPHFRSSQALSSAAADRNCRIIFSTTHRMKPRWSPRPRPSELAFRDIATQPAGTRVLPRTAEALAFPRTSTEEDAGEEVSRPWRWLRPAPPLADAQSSVRLFLERHLDKSRPCPPLSTTCPIPVSADALLPGPAHPRVAHSRSSAGPQLRFRC